MRIYKIIALFLLLSIHAHAAYLCGDTGFVFSESADCNANCSNTCQTVQNNSTNTRACNSGSSYVYSKTLKTLKVKIQNNI